MLKYKNMRTNYIVLFLAIIILVFSCEKKDERHLYEKELKRTSYKAYKAISGTTLGTVLVAYNATSDEEIPFSSVYVRLLAGYGWTVMKKPVYTFAEANLILEESDDLREQALAHLLLSIGMYEKGWPVIAKQESDIGLAGLKNTGVNDAETEILIVHILAGTVCIYDRNFDLAKVHFQGIGDITGIKWPVLLIDAMADIENGDIQKGLTKIKEASKDESIPREIREAMEEMIKDIENKTGKIDGPLFWPRLIGLALFDELKESANPTIEKIGKIPSEFCDKLSF